MMRGKKFLAGSSLTCDPAPAPAQEPVLPVCQLEPSIAEIKVAEEALQPRVVVRDGKKKPAPRPFVKSRTTRQRYMLSREDVVALLDKPGVTEALPPMLCAQYRTFTARNISLDELAAKHHVSMIAMEAIVDGWESDIVAKTCELYPRFKPRGTEEELRDGEKAENEALAAQDAEVLKSGGDSIGGRIVSRGRSSKTGNRLALDTFERGGHLRETDHSPDKDRGGSQISEEDNYGENSGDDIFRSE